MRKRKLVASLISLLTVVILIFVMAVETFATDESQVLEPESQYVEETQEMSDETVPPTQEETQPEAKETQEPEQPQESYEEEEPQETQAPTYYEAYGDDLPQVEESDIVEPTKMAIPDVEVSDTSLIGGVIAWLCVAVGIAVIAGVLVSQRTRQVGSNSKDNRRR